MANGIGQAAAVKAPVNEENVKAAEAAEIDEAFEVVVSGGKTVRMTQETVPTGIFPLPARLLHWAGLK
jgi:hypothetical protein